MCCCCRYMISKFLVDCDWGAIFQAGVVVFCCPISLKLLISWIHSFQLFLFGFFWYSLVLGVYLVCLCYFLIF